MKRWGLLALGVLGIAVVVWAQTIHKETVVWDFVNGVKSQGEWLTPGGGGGGTGDVQVSGTPTAGQLARWTDATHIEGVEASGGLGLPSDPVACPANQFVRDQDASGTLACAQPSIDTLSDAGSVVRTSRTLTVNGTANQISVTGGAQSLAANRTWTIALATNPTLPGTTMGTFSGPLTGNVTGNVTGNASTASAVSFTGLTTGTNTSAAMVLDTGASLGYTGSGTIDASHLGGVVAAAYAKLAGGGQQILTGTQIVPRPNLQTITANAFTINLDTTDVAVVPALSAGVTVNAPTATGSNPRDYHELLIVFLPSASPQSITWNSAFSPRGGIALPTAVTGDNSTLDVVKYVYMPTITKYVLWATTIGTEPGITTLASSATFTCPHLSSRSCKMVNTEAAGSITIAIPSGGTPVDGKQLVMRVKCTNAQTIIFATGAGAFIASPNIPLTGYTCPAGGTSWSAFGVEYSDTLDRFQLYAVN
jgi:hypothetical protein